MSSNVLSNKSAIIIGGGPAGLMAAETLALAGVRVDVYDGMASVGRKFLLAGKGGMNLSHAEGHTSFVARYGSRSAEVSSWLDVLSPDSLRAWVHELGIATFVGSSGRVFPTDMKAAPLLRAWLHRLRQLGVRFHMRHRWLGWADVDEIGRDEVDRNAFDGKALRFATPTGETRASADVVVLALGGGSWSRLGSDGAWVSLLNARGVRIAPLQPANCGFDVDWSAHFRARFAGHALKTIALTCVTVNGEQLTQRGEFIVTEKGVESSLIYALSAHLRDAITAQGTQGRTVLHLDLLPDWSAERVLAEVVRPRGSRSWASHLQSRLGLKGVKTGLLREFLSGEDFDYPDRIGAAIKALPLRLLTPRPLDEAISSAGGVALEALDAGLMLRALPGVFCAGEMLDWEAPTGGYLLTACFASGRVAGRGVLHWLNRLHPSPP